MSEPERFTLANRDHLSLFMLCLVLSGGACPECGYGTRATSKRWARCKRPGCNTRVRRRTKAEVEAELDRLNEEARMANGTNGQEKIAQAALVTPTDLETLRGVTCCRAHQEACAELADRLEAAMGQPPHAWWSGTVRELSPDLAPRLAFYMRPPEGDEPRAELLLYGDVPK